MPKHYSMYIGPINIYGKDLTWGRVQEILNEFILLHRPKECLEVEIITLLIDKVNELMITIDKILYYLNTYCTKKKDRDMVELLNGGGKLYCKLVDILEESVHKLPKSSYSDRIFIRRLLGINGHLFDLFKLIDNIEEWNDTVLYELNE